MRYKVQADLFATVDRTLAERAHEFGRLYVLGAPDAGRQARITIQNSMLTTERRYVLDSCASGGSREATAVAIRGILLMAVVQTFSYFTRS